jgi:hypothetical protein
VKAARSVAAAVVIVFALAACSSNSSATSGPTTTPSATSSALSAADFVAGMCTAMTDYQQSVQQLQTSFNPNTTDLAQLKQSWLDFLDGLIASTGTLVSKVQALGVPDTSDGQAASDALTKDFGQLHDDLQSLRDHSATLSPNNQAEFMTNFEALITQFQTDMQGFGQDLSQLQTGELDTAFSAAPECASIASASPAV